MNSLKLVAGLGNPGKKYENTPHNLGFMVVDELAARFSCRLRGSLRIRGRVGKTAGGGAGFFLLKPRTYMNNSGAAVSAALRYWKIESPDMLVVVDDADLEPGRIRLRPSGGSAGHNGLKSIMEHTGGGEFARIRVGVGRGTGERPLADFLLSPLGVFDEEWVRDAVTRAADAVEMVSRQGLEPAMNRYNNGNAREGGR